MDKGLIITIQNDEIMPIDVQRFVFEKGYSTKGKGRGFGTYGSKLLMDKYLDGQLEYESNREKGTIFKMLLPWEVQK